MGQKHPGKITGSGPDCKAKCKYYFSTDPDILYDSSMSPTAGHVSVSQTDVALLLLTLPIIEMGQWPCSCTGSDTISEISHNQQYWSVCPYSQIHNTCQLYSLTTHPILFNVPSITPQQHLLGDICRWLVMLWIWIYVLWPFEALRPKQKLLFGTNLYYRWKFPC